MRTVPIRKIGTRHQLFLGADREMVMFAGLLAFALAFQGQTWYAIAFGGLLWLGALSGLRLMAKFDPRMRDVYLRHRRYATYYAAHSTAWRVNTPAQTYHYQTR